MGKYRCSKCDYRFEIDMEGIPKLCPNCGEKEFVEKEKSAGELIEDL